MVRFRDVASAIEHVLGDNADDDRRDLQEFAAQCRDESPRIAENAIVQAVCTIADCWEYMSGYYTYQCGSPFFSPQQWERIRELFPADTGDVVRCYRIAERMGLIVDCPLGPSGAE